MSEPREPTLTDLANAAFRQAAVKVIQLAKQTGTPVIIWRDGRVQAVPPEELEATLDLTPQSPIQLDGAALPQDPSESVS